MDNSHSCSGTFNVPLRLCWCRAAARFVHVTLSMIESIHAQQTYPWCIRVSALLLIDKVTNNFILQCVVNFKCSVSAPGMLKYNPDDQDRKNNTCAFDLYSFKVY